MRQRSSSLLSAAPSPVSTPTWTPAAAPMVASQRAARLFTCASIGDTYAQRPSPPVAMSMRRMANSAHTTSSDPAGAATRQLSSLPYSALNVCVWIGLKCIRPWMPTCASALEV